MACATAPGADAAAPICWEETDCPLCDSSAADTVITVLADEDPGYYRVVRCNACGMAYLNPRPDEASIGHFYTNEYEEYQPPEDKDRGWWGVLRGRLEKLVLARYHGYPVPRGHRYERLLAALARHCLHVHCDDLGGVPFHGEGKLLDFGCGAGWFAQRMQERGWKVTGMDFSAYTARQVRERFGISVLVGTLPHPEVAAESFDVITMGCVLEHVHRPQEVIAAAVRALRPGGLLAVAVPNLASWGFHLFGQDWWPLELPRHLLHFTPATLRCLMEGHGLEVCKIEMLRRCGWMRRSLARARRRPSTPLSHRLLTRVASPRPLTGLLTRASVWAGQADGIWILARKPEACVAVSPLPQRAA